MAIFTESSNRQLKQPGAAAEGRIARFGSAQPRTNGLIKPSWGVIPKDSNFDSFSFFGKYSGEITSLG